MVDPAMTSLPLLGAVVVVFILVVVVLKVVFILVVVVLESFYRTLNVRLCSGGYRSPDIECYYKNLLPDHDEGRSKFIEVFTVGLSMARFWDIHMMIIELSHSRTKTVHIVASNWLVSLFLIMFL